MKKLFLLLLSLSLVFAACKKEEDIIYGVNQVNADSYNSGKDKLKSISQYISIVYANLFQKALSANELVEITNCIESIGDKEVAHEIVLSNFMNKPDVIMPLYTKVKVLGNDTITEELELTFASELMCMDSLAFWYDETVIYIDPTLDNFLEETYKRFFIRNITEAEREHFTHFFETHPNVSVEMIYTAFSLSNEYQFY